MWGGLRRVSSGEIHDAERGGHRVERMQAQKKTSWEGSLMLNSHAWRLWANIRHHGINYILYSLEHTHGTAVIYNPIRSAVS